MFQEQQVRTIIRDDEPWWVAKDVCSVLGYRNHKKSISDHVDDDERDGVTIRDLIGRSQTITVINQSGLYSLILRSRMPQAKAFKRWVTHEVLPAIMRTGRYDVPQREPYREITDRSAELIAIQRDHIDLQKRYIVLLEEKSRAVMLPGRRNPLTEEEKKRIINLKISEPKLGCTAIGRHVGRSESAVRKVLNDARQMKLW